MRLFVPPVCARMALGIALTVSALPAEAASLAPTAPLLGDGKTVSSLQLLTNDPTARVKIKSDRGRVGAITPTAGGVLFEFIPPAVTEPTTVTLQIQVRGATSEDLSIPVELVPPWIGFDISFDPPVLSATEPTTVRVTPKGKAPIADGSRQLRIVASSGTVGDLVPSNGTWVARYTPPKDLKDPLQVQFVVADLSAPFETIGHGVGSVAVKRSLTFDAPPDSNAVLKIGAREFGPVKASPSGKAAFDVDVAPDQRRGQLTTVTPDGTRATVDLELPFTVAAAITAAPLPARAPSGSTVPVTFVCRKPDGVTCSAEDVQVTVAAGSVASPVLVAPGVIRADWTLPDPTATATLTATFFDQTVQASLQVVDSPVSITMSADPAALPPGKNDFSVVAHVKDARGTGVTGKAPRFSFEGATPIGKPVDNKDGSYTQKARASAEPATVYAAPALAASGLPPRALIAWSDTPAVWADGTSTARVVVLAEDALGLPVAGVELTLSVPVGDGSVAPKIKTDEHGVARVSYRIGSAPGPVTIVAEGAGLKTATTLWQTAPGGSAPEVRPTGSPEYLASLARWQRATPSVAVGRAAEVVAAAPVAPVAPVAPSPVAPPPTTAPPTTAPPTMAGAPTTTSIGGPQPTGAVRAPSAGGTPVMRVRGALVDAPLRYRSEASGTAADVAPAAAFNTSPAFGTVGLEGGVEAWFGDVAVDASLSTYTFRVAVGEEKFAHAMLDGHLGARYRFWDNGGAVSAYGAFGAARTNGLYFVYANEARTAAELVPAPLYGGRVAVGGRYEAGALLVDAAVAEIFAPLPVHTRLDLGLDVPLSAQNLALNLGAGFATRHMSLSPGGTEEERLKVGMSGWDVGAGVTYLAF